VKKTFFYLFAAMVIGIFACKKNDPGIVADLSLIQHKWQVMSLSGEALRYVGKAGDYYNFSTDNFLYIHVGNSYDTLAYVLLPDKKTLSAYVVVNGVRTNQASNYDIKVIDANRFVFGNYSGVGFGIQDILKR
jgi:hypothetical protein